MMRAIPLSRLQWKMYRFERIQPKWSCSMFRNKVCIMSGSACKLRHFSGWIWLVTLCTILMMCSHVNGQGERASESIDLSSMMMPHHSSTARQIHEHQNQSWIIGKSGGRNICSSVDIRNNMSGWRPQALAECDIIEGSLSIVVITQNQTSDAIKSISFPRLKQVTHFVLFYRVLGLQTFSEMFPSLAVIRGYQLFHEYALVVFENLQLRDMGLVGLRRVLRGTVRIEKNPHLCFLDTVNWQHITSRNDHVIQDNTGDDDCESRVCDKKCSNFTSVHGLRPACWNVNHCQQFQEPHRCHQFCEGGCTRPDSASHCVACASVSLDGACLDSCPGGTYLHEGWRCIQKEQCVTLKLDPPNNGTYLAFNGSCISECPAGYMPTANKSSCKKCIIGNCPKVCKGKMIDSAERAQKLKGCTIIDGSLRIQVSGENIVQELEENLKDIKEITGFLRVSYSHPLMSLTFLRNLQVIHGEELEPDQYALYFLHNHNLRTLWPNSTNFVIKRGRAFFHFNHKLCLDIIDNLLTKLGLETDDTLEVGQMTNGDKVPCKVKNLNVEFVLAFKHHAIIRWTNFRNETSDYRNLLGYNLYYREAPVQNVSLFTGRSACGGDQWKAVDYRANAGKNDTWVKQLLPNLKPFTQYAFYVETLMAGMGSKARMGQSNVTYFTSAPAVPTVPRNLKLYSMEGALRIEWDPPALPNGIITHYFVVARYTPESVDRNFAFCKDTDMSRPAPSPEPTVPTITNGSSGGGGVGVARVPGRHDNCCECSAESWSGGPAGPGGSAGIDRDTKKEQNWFEDLIQNTVFRKKKKDTRQSRGRRSINTTAISAQEYEDGVTPAPAPPVQAGPCVSWLEQGGCEVFEFDVPATNATKNGTVLRQLPYFAEYMVEVYACEHYLSCSNESMKAFRSPPAIGSKKTLKNDTADGLTARPVISNQTSSSQVLLYWFDPERPNGGHVLSYVIHIRRVDGDVEERPSKTDKCPADRCETPPCRQEQQLQLPVGNISIQVQARTLAGLGPMSAPIYYNLAAPKSVLSPGEVIAIVIGVCLVIALGAFAFCYRRNVKSDIHTSWNPYYGGPIPSYLPDDWEVDMEKVYFDHVVGTGSFGSVYEGTALLRARDEDGDDQGDDTEQLYRVAIKTLLEDANMFERQAFLAEASLMKEFRCYHVVRLMGIVSNMSAKTASNIPRPPFVIMELMGKGDLKSYLRSMRPDDSDVHIPDNCPVLPHIYKMAIQIADGMAYLAQVNSVHRDLAARNCLVSDDVTIKIGDFGMTRHLCDKNYYRKDGKGLLPVRWMGPESLMDGRFTSQSDVWSFGVVLWEMATYGAQPYPGLSNEEVMKHVTSRNRMSLPRACPQRLYDIMCRCWDYRPNDRPTFVALVEELLPLVGSDFAEHSFYHTQRPAMLAAAAADTASDPVEEPEPTVLTPLTAAVGDRGTGRDSDAGTVARHARMAEAEDLTDEEDCDVELRPIASIRSSHRADPEANYAEFEAMRMEGRNGGHGSLSSAENSKAHSLQFSSSDGSKDSKASNGSARNGYIASGGVVSLQRTAEC